MKSLEKCRFDAGSKCLTFYVLGISCSSPGSQPCCEGMGFSPVYSLNSPVRVSWMLTGDEASGSETWGSTAHGRGGSRASHTQWLPCPQGRQVPSVDACLCTGSCYRRGTLCGERYCFYGEREQACSLSGGDVTSFLEVACRKHNPEKCSG